MARLLEMGDPYWVIGIIDAHGAIHARMSRFGDRDTPMHSDEDRLSGRPFRWNCHSQEFHDVLARSDRLSPDDCIIVADWLEREGYKEPGKD